jgi:hypothetical protein
MFASMKMADHIRRFSMPPPGFVAASSGAGGPPSTKPIPASPMSTLAQIYSIAQQQAIKSVRQRQWDILFKQLFDR